MWLVRKAPTHRDETKQQRIDCMCVRSNKELVCLSGSHSSSVPEVGTLTLASTLTREQGSPIYILGMTEPPGEKLILRKTEEEREGGV